jgi:cytochrome b subunit of formate dehydrogenase
LVIFHIVRALFILTPSDIRIRWRDFSGSVISTTAKVLDSPRTKKRISKYSIGQKAFLHAVALVVLVAIATGLVMMVDIDSPFWDKNPFIISAGSMGLVFVLHGFAGLFSITMIIVHFYFAVRPQKMYMTRSMLRGWINRKECERNHDLVQ